MLESIKSFFQQHLDWNAAETDHSAEHRARLAAAALFIEVSRADGEFSAIERDALRATLAQKFDLDANETHQLIALADASVREAVDLYQFTSEINRRFTPEQKLRLIEHLWRVAFADNVLHPREEHLIRRIADLIYVPHSAFIAAKLRVQQNAS